jgi:predicted MFS family arabinose efflux permease
MKTREAYIKFLVICVLQYATQNLFFVSVAAFLSKAENSVLSVGNLLLVAMIPFFISAFFLASRFNRIHTTQQLKILKCLRALAFVTAACGLWAGGPTLTLIYGCVFFVDMGFFMFLSTATRACKELSQNTSVKETESGISLANQLGMIGGGALAGVLVTHLSLSQVFLICCIFEFTGLALSFTFHSNGVVVQNPRKHGTVLKSLAFVWRNKQILWIIAPFTLVLPLIQVFNLIAGPWAQSVFRDDGKTLALVSSGLAAGACIGSLALFRIRRIRESKTLHLAPLLIALGGSLLFLSSTSGAVLLNSVVLGLGFASSRVAANSIFVEHAPSEKISELSMLGLMLSLVLSTSLVLVLRRVPPSQLIIAFAVLAGLTVLQSLFLIFNQRSFRPCRID